MRNTLEMRWNARGARRKPVWSDFPSWSKYAALRAEYPRLGPASEKALLAVNQEYVGGEYRLQDGDELALIPPVSGG